MTNSEMLSKLINTLKDELPDGTEIKLSPPGISPRISVILNAPYDPLRKSKTFQPIIIQLHESFGTSEFAKRPFLEIRKEFASFIRNQRAQFVPRTTDNPSEPHTADYWIFPPTC